MPVQYQLLHVELPEKDAMEGGGIRKRGKRGKRSKYKNKADEFFGKLKSLSPGSLYEELTDIQKLVWNGLAEKKALPRNVNKKNFEIFEDIYWERDIDSDVYCSVLFPSHVQSNGIHVMYLVDEALVLYPVPTRASSTDSSLQDVKSMTPRIIQQRSMLFGFIGSIDLEIAKAKKDKKQEEEAMYNGFLEEVIKTVENKIGSHIIHMYIKAIPISKDVIAGKDTYTLESYIISTKKRDNAVLIDLNMRDIVLSCKTIKNGNLVDGINFVHLQESLIPKRETGAVHSLLLVVASVGGKLQGIRVTSLKVGEQASVIFGKYLCAKGYGAILQNETERLLRNELASYGTIEGISAPLQGQSWDMTTRDALPKSVENFFNTPYLLDAVEGAVGFWKKMGFNHDLDAEGNPVVKEQGKNLESVYPMWKQIFPAPAASAVGKRSSGSRMTSKS